MTRTWTPSQLVRSLRIAPTGSRGRARAEAFLNAFGRAVVFDANRAPSSATLQRSVDIELARDIRGSNFFTVQPRALASPPTRRSGSTGPTRGGAGVHRLAVHPCI